MVPASVTVLLKCCNVNLMLLLSSKFDFWILLSIGLYQCKQTFTFPIVYWENKYVLFVCLSLLPCDPVWLRHFRDNF